ncbi:Discoidin domain-containing receptor 2 [Armadillidium nasatum]|uniref:Discoidin domain-containing receptor 2 n=1 Tax=Armadillidium nasatum TaxID=96803 RepID=A0A5N5TM79_9CRUS|nr:Discoidin domain-containing receptor 2 [Armadillidium nasatum]
MTTINSSTGYVLLKMVTQAADGLAYLCSKHLVHRDVAARNCLINASYTLKIADLGMAGPPCYEGTKCTCCFVFNFDSMLNTFIFICIEISLWLVRVIIYAFPIIYR